MMDWNPSRWYYIVKKCLKIGMKMTVSNSYLPMHNSVCLANRRTCVDSFPTITMERRDEDIKNFYQPRDLVIGNTVNIFRTDYLIYDCDAFTRDYLKEKCGIDEMASLNIDPEKKSDRSNVSVELLSIA